MSRETKHFRSAMAQTPRNKKAYGIVIWEILIVAIAAALGTGYAYHSDMVTLYSFGAYCGLLGALLVFFRPLFYLLMGICWAVPFFCFGAIFLGIIAFVVSCFVNYYGITFLEDLSGVNDGNDFDLD